MVVVWWRLLTSLQLSLFASHVTSSTMRNEGVVEGVSDITRDGDAAEGVTLWGLPELSGRTLSGLAAVSALTLSLLPRPCRGGATGQSATLWRLVPWWCPIYNFSKQLVHRGLTGTKIWFILTQIRNLLVIRPDFDANENLTRRIWGLMKKSRVNGIQHHQVVRSENIFVLGV